jgi:hypothetical protein
MHDWYDALSLGEKMAIWQQYKEDGHGKFLEKAYKEYLKNFKLKVVA